MPDSKNKPGKVIYWRDGNLIRNLKPCSVENLKFLTPLEARTASEEGWSKIIAKMKTAG